jgi:uncharacterized protein (TIGR02145 family)
LEINVYDKNATDFDDANGKYTTGFFVEYIKILAYGRTHIEIYGTTIHEIAHSSHYENGLFFKDLPKILKESYARGVQRYLSIKRYGDWSKAFYDNEYTGIFEDLEDANSTYAKLKGFENPCDRVSGITVPMAEKALFASLSWDNFKYNLMKIYPDGTINNEGKRVTYTTADMDALFKYWEAGEGASPCPAPTTSSAKPSSSNTVAGSLTDIRDKKIYKTTVIGTQTWMAENLNYNASGSVCYGNYAGNCKTYGRLYNWVTALDLPPSCNSISCSGQVKEKHKGICPSGWHLPSMEDWNKLMRYVDNVNSTSSPYDSPKAGIYLKAKSGWSSGYIGDIYKNGNGENKYGFSALPGGIGNPGGGFKDMGYNGDWWSTAEYDDSGAYRFDLYYGDKAGWSDVGGTNRRYDKASLFSIRCVKD